MKKLLALGAAVCALAGVARAAAGPTLLPNGWRLAPPDAAPTTLGTLPQGITLSRDGKRVFIVESGYHAPGLRIVDLASGSTSFVALKGAFGRAVLDTGDGAWVSGGSADAVYRVDTATGSVDRTIALPKDFNPSGIDRSPDGKQLAVAGDTAHALVFVDVAGGTSGAPIEVARHPAAVLWVGSTVYVAGWAQSEVDAIDVGSRMMRAQIAVGLHPEALAVAGDRLYVADADDDALSVVDLGSDHQLAEVPLGLHDTAVAGISPNSVRISPDGRRIYVTCGAANAVVALAPTSSGARVIGAVPTGWYPTDTAVAGDGLLIVDGKGESSHANADYAPFARSAGPRAGYIAGNLVGSLRRMPVPTDSALIAGVSAVMGYEREPVTTRRLLGGAGVLQVVRAGGVIKHVIFVIKENRTYDQVLGDIPNANGDPHLAIFGERVTPNEHAIARRFGLYDNYDTNSHVSADGHNWSMAAYANDYLEKYWPPNYGGRRKTYDFEDGAEASVPHNGYLWDLAARSRVSIRNYGEFTTRPKESGGGWTTTLPALRAVTDPRGPGFDLTIPDSARINEWAREFAAYEKNGTLPQLEILRLPNDHTAGTRAGMPTPDAYVAENDVAVGRLIEIVSHAKDWPSTAIFIIEDDAQNGPDHVDEQRSTLYVVSPYSAPGVHHEHFTQVGVVRTIETILGMAPLTPYDGQARILYEAFSTANRFGNKPDMQPYRALKARVDLRAKNTAQAYRANDAATIDLSRADAVPEAELNDMLAGAARSSLR